VFRLHVDTSRHRAVVEEPDRLEEPVRVEA